MEGFLEQVAQDMADVFLDLDFFGVEAMVEGKKILIVLDNDKLKEKQGGQDLAVAESATLLCPHTGLAAQTGSRRESEHQWQRMYH